MDGAIWTKLVRPFWLVFAIVSVCRQFRKPQSKSVRVSCRLLARMSWLNLKASGAWPIWISRGRGDLQSTAGR